MPMDRVTVRSSTYENKVYAFNLLSLLDTIDKRIKILSLDCFDTILWRQTATPIDVFYDLQQRPSFKALNYSSFLRVRSEAFARQLMRVKTGATEVTLSDIYKTAFPNLDSQQLAALTEDELAAEIEACYAFPPVIEFMRAAHEKGLKLIIVSDTYLTEKQLRCLLSSKLPADVMAVVTKIICSCEHGKSKSNGLFADVLKKVKMPPAAILHLGDNEIADFTSPQKLGIPAVHLVHHKKNIADLLHMQLQSASFFDPTLSYIRSLSSPFKGFFAAQNMSIEKPEVQVGYVSLGQIMYAFAKCILLEMEHLTQLNKNPKVLFLMRDGYLPAMMCEAVAGKSIGHKVRISRFVAIASSFRTQHDIEKYLAEIIDSSRLDMVCKQLLLPDDMVQSILKKTEASRYPVKELIRFIHKKDVVDCIIKRSKACFERLKKHLKNEAAIEEGDTLLFVDLGYTGTVQLKLQPIFQQEMNIEVKGCYLLSLATPESEKHRTGLLNSSWCDNRALLTIVNYIAILEQLCTSSDRSVIDFNEDGNPIFSDTAITDQQHTKLKHIQNECLRFAVDAERFFRSTNTSLTIATLRDIALAELSRLIFLPSKNEVQHMQDFQFDINLGTKDLLKMFDQEEGLRSLRKRGMFFMETDLKSMRTNYPAELRSAGLGCSLMLMSINRFGLTFRNEDFSLKQESINIIVMRNNDVSTANLEAIPTHDGYFSLMIPMGEGDFQVGVILGENYQWIQIESAELIKQSAFFSGKESQYTLNIAENIILDQMNDKNGGLFECVSNTSLLMIDAIDKKKLENTVFRLVFRPIVYRQKSVIA